MCSLQSFSSQNVFRLRPGQWLISVHNIFNFFYINIMRHSLSWSWKPWRWDIGKNKQRDTLRALWAVNDSSWHALTGHFILTLLNQLDGENSKLTAKVLWQFFFTTVVINRCCYPLSWEPNIPWGRFVGCADCSEIRDRLRVGGVLGKRAFVFHIEQPSSVENLRVKVASVTTEHISICVKHNSVSAGWRCVSLIFISWNTTSKCSIYKLTISFPQWFYNTNRQLGPMKVVASGSPVLRMSSRVLVSAEATKRIQWCPPKGYHRSPIPSHNLSQ